MSQTFKQCCAKSTLSRVFPRLFRIGGTIAGGQSVNGGGLMRRGLRSYGGPNFDRLCHNLKVLALIVIDPTSVISIDDALIVR